MEDHDHASLMLGDDDPHDHPCMDGEEEEMDIEPNRVLVETSFWEHEPTKDEIWEMKKATKRPSEWLKLLCKEWADENLALVETADSKFEAYKPYLKGKLSSQLLCRLCIPSDIKDEAHNSNNNPTEMDFLKNILDIRDDFDRAYVIAQVERFCAVYDVRGLRQQSETFSNRFVGQVATTTSNEAAAAAAAALYGDLVVNALGNVTDVHQQAIAAAAAATANHPHTQFLTADATAAAVAAAQQAVQQQQQHESHHPSSSSSSKKASHDALGNKNAQALLTKAQQQAKSAERALEQERRQNAKREQRRLSQDKKLARQRDREFLQKQKLAEKQAREKAREEKRTKKLLQRQERERFAQEQKEAALRRAAELVASNRVPIEITRAGGRGKGAKNPKIPGMIVSKTTEQQMALEKAKAGESPPVSSSLEQQQSAPNAASTANVPKKRQRSAIIVSTASDLDRIVTHSQNLWAKYNAIAKEHNQRVNWITVAKELGIHVKVREKYARMHSRACQRNFDFVANGHWKIKDHPEIFQEPTPAEQKARMPPPLPPPMTTDAKFKTTEKSSSTAVQVSEEEDPGTSCINNNAANNTKVELPSPDEVVQVEEVSMMEAPTTEEATMDEGRPAAASTNDTQDNNNDDDDDGASAAVVTVVAPDPLAAAAAAATAAAVVDAAGVGAGAAMDLHHMVVAAANNATGETEGGPPVVARENLSVDYTI